MVLAYGGWEDIFTGALAGLVKNSSLYPEVLWTFFDDAPSIPDHLINIISPGIQRNRLNLYAGIDCHTFLPKLRDKWLESTPSDEIRDPKVIQTTALENSGTASKRAALFRLPSLECDRPPSIDIWVGRDDEIRSLETSPAKIVSICGFGGQGKSVLAAKYLELVSQGETQFDHWDWRDCKEQSDRMRTQIIDIIERISLKELTSSKISGVTDEELVEIFVDITSNASTVFVLDNVDHYVELEARTYTGILDLLVRKFAAAKTNSRLLITCRPKISYGLTEAITFLLKGLSIDETYELFIKRAGKEGFEKAEIDEAHSLTEGHAFWLDLMFAQVSRVPGVTLKATSNNGEFGLK